VRPARWSVPILVAVGLAVGACTSSSTQRAGSRRSTIPPPGTPTDSTAVSASTSIPAATTTSSKASMSPAVPTTTTTTGPPPCVGSQFVAGITTSAPTYPVGAAIPISLAITNAGVTCESEPSTSNADVLDGCPSVSAFDATGHIVWEAAVDPSTKTQTVCATVGVAGPVPTGWSKTFSFSWNQGECPGPGIQCTEAQVSSGTYSIDFAAMGGIWNGIAVKPARLTVT